MPDISFNTEATLKFLQSNFKPQKVKLQRLEQARALPDILVVSDLDGSKWGCFTNGLRSAYDAEQNRKNAEAFNQYSNRFIVADATGQDLRMTRHLNQVYGKFEVLDFLVNDAGLDLRVNQESLRPDRFITSLNADEAFNPHSDWEKFIASFFDRRQFYELLQQVLDEKGFKEIHLDHSSRPTYIYPDCHKLYRSSAYPGIDISISPGEMSIVTVETRQRQSLGQVDSLVRDLSNQLQSKISQTLVGQDAARVTYQVGLGEDFGYAFFTHADKDKQVSKAVIPYAILEMLEDRVLNSLKAIICIGDGANDRHLGLTEVQYGNKTLPVYRIVSGKGLYNKNPDWLKRDAGRLELTEVQGDIAEALHRVVKQIN